MSGTGTQMDFTFCHLACDGLRNYPWFSNADLDMLSTGSGVAVLEKLVTSIAGRNTLRPYHPDDRLIMDKFNLLPESRPFTTSLQSHSTAHREYIFTMFLFRYRVLDVGLWLQGHSELETPGEVMRISLPDTKDIAQFKKLHDWPDLVLSARNLCASPRKVISVADQGFDSAQLKHISLYVQRTELHKQEKIFVNWDTAALYLSHLLEGFSDLDSSNAPQALVDQIKKDPSVPLRRIKIPLHLALTVSPIVLLLPTNLVNSTCGRPQMIEIWQALGSERPECIRIAERELWQALFDMSLSPILDTRQRLHSALDNILSALHDMPPKHDDLVFFYTNPMGSVRSIPDKTLTDVAMVERHPVVHEEEEEEEEEGNGPDGEVEEKDRTSQDDEMVVDQDIPARNTNGRPEDEAADVEMDETLTPGMAGGGTDGEVDDKMDDYQDTPTPAVDERPEIGMEVEVEGGCMLSMANGGEGKPSEENNVNVIGDADSNTNQDVQTSGIDDQHTPLTTTIDSEGGFLLSESRDENEGEGNTSPSPTNMTSAPTAKDNETEMEMELDENPSDAPANVSKEVLGDTTSSQSTVTAVNSTASSHKKLEKVRTPPERQSVRIANKPPASAPPNPAPLRPVTKPKKRTSLTQTKASKPQSGSPVTDKKPLAMQDIENSLDPKPLPLPSITIQTVETQLRVTASLPSRLYGCKGLDDFLDYCPSFHYDEHLNWFHKVISAVQQSYSGGYPLHLANPDNSSIRIMDFATFDSLSSEDMQSIFKKQHIVVHGYPCRPTAFDEKGLRFLAPSHKPITIHDMSILPESTDGNERHEIGLTGHLLESHRSPNGKILNALDFPMPGRGVRPPETLATDILAYHETLEDPHYSRLIPPPLSDLYWGLAATNHSFHYFHIDSDGFGTTLAAQTGGKYWILARPKPGKSFAATDMFTTSNYAIDEMNMELWDVEAILLTPGTCLFMKPNTPHLVLTPQASICYGGHFYASSTLRSTCHGILHTFVACSLLTNTEHTDGSRELLRRLLYFYYKAFQTDYVVDGPAGKAISPKYKGDIPDIFTFNGLLDVFSLCNLMEIWLAANIEIHHPHIRLSPASLEHDVFYPYLASQVAALLFYKKRAPNSGAQGHVEFTLQDLVHHINGAFVDDPRFQACYHPETDPKTFDWTGTTFQVQPVEGDWKPMPDNENGLTFDDREWNKKGKGQGIGEEDEHPSKKRARV